jgi:hypothetical protein
MRAMQAELIEEFRVAREGRAILGQRKTHEIRQDILDRREILLQFLNQSDVIVDLGGMGEQSAKYSVLKPPESRLNDENRGLPPIFLIPGIRNDLECVMLLAQEYAYTGRMVVVVAMPESYRGKVTEEFASGVVSNGGYELHAEFYKKAIAQLRQKHLSEQKELELVGWSTGCAIIENILQDPSYQNMVTRATLYCRASSANIDSKSLILGTLNELKTVLTKNFPNYVFSREGDPNESRQAVLKKIIFDKMLKTVCRKRPVPSKMRVKEGGEIIYWHGEQDELTRSAQMVMDPELQTDSEIKVVVDREGFHNTPVLEPKRVMEQISAKLTKERGS